MNMMDNNIIINNNKMNLCYVQFLFFNASTLFDFLISDTIKQYLYIFYKLDLKCLEANSPNKI